LASLQGEGLAALLKLIPLFGFVAIFWSLYDQSGSSWVLQAKDLDRRLVPGMSTEGSLGWLGEPLHVETVQAINPFLILVLVPFFSYVVYPLVGRVTTLTPLRKIGAGFFLTFLSFLIIAWLQRRIDQGAQPSVHWQFLAYLIITAGEVLVSVTCLRHRTR
jgi:POT family proton-dependent oligopeptide transporter